MFLQLISVQSLMAALSCPALRDPMDLARQAPLSMGLSRSEYWEGWPFPSPAGSSAKQGSNPGLPHFRPLLYRLIPQGSPPGPTPDAASPRKPAFTPSLSVCLSHAAGVCIAVPGLSPAVMGELLEGSSISACPSSCWQAVPPP